MVRLICALVLVLLTSTPSLGQQSLVETYKVISHVREINGVPTEPSGYLTYWYPFLCNQLHCISFELTAKMTIPFHQKHLLSYYTNS